jgi:hypothetical protein
MANVSFWHEREVPGAHHQRRVTEDSNSEMSSQNIPLKARTDFLTLDFRSANLLKSQWSRSHRARH